MASQQFVSVLDIKLKWSWTHQKHNKTSVLRILFPENCTSRLIFFKTSVKRIIIRLMKVKIPKIMCDKKSIFYRFTNNNDKRKCLSLGAISKGSSFKHRSIPLHWIKIIIILVNPVSITGLDFFYNDYSFSLTCNRNKNFYNSS